MAYGSRSARTSPLPSDWNSYRRPTVLERDGFVCQWKISRDGTKCGRQATDVDHIGAADDHRIENLRALCGPHHRRRSGTQGAEAMHARRIPRQRPAERHPGLL